MDRLNKVHRIARVDLPKSVIGAVPQATESVRSRRIKPGMAHALAITGFMMCGGLIVATCVIVAVYTL